MNNKSLLILACGQGSRNAAFTFDGAMPKCLQTAGDKTILEAILAKYDDLTTMRYIACLAQHKQQIDDILAFKGIANVKTIAVAKQVNAMASLAASCIAIGLQTITESDWYINWSDVFATMPTKHPVDATIFIDAKYQHRNIAFRNIDGYATVLSTFDLCGNVPGIFYVPGDKLQGIVSGFDASKDGDTDFDKVLAATCLSCKLHRLSDVVDLGDYNKFAQYMTNYASEHQSRYFNDIKIGSKTILKRPVDEYGMKLHRIELAYYKNIADRLPVFAQLQSYNRESATMELEKINGVTCQAKLDACQTQQTKQNKADKLLEAFDTAIAQVHELKTGNVPDAADLQVAIRNEFLNAMRTRVQPVQSLITAVIASGVSSIDGMPITKSFEDLYQAVEHWLDTKLQAGYFKGAITHGDPNTDNCMVQTDGNIRFIDPRGYFGGLKVLGYGIKQYDYAKFVYGMTGYSRFNRASFIACKVEDGDVKTYIGLHELEGISDVDLFKLDIDDDIRILVGIIWVKLSSYIINDPERSVLAYLYGNALLTKLLAIK